MVEGEDEKSLGPKGATERFESKQYPRALTEAEAWEEALRRIEAAKQSGSGVTLAGLGLQSVPQEIAQVPHLKILLLMHNRLREFPTVLRQLSDLQLLELSDNSISQVPDWLAEMPKLALIALQGNPLPEEIIAAAMGGTESLFRYLRAASEEGDNPRTVKLVLLGEPRSGKTTLLEALKGNTRPCDPNRKETVGVDVVSIPVASPVDELPMYLSAWDFAGQHIEHATHQFFLTEGALYLILWNARQGTESGKRDLWYWLELLKMRVREPRFLLVATHSQHTPPDLNLPEIERTYPGCQGNFAVDLEGLTGFDALRAKVLELAAQSPSLHAKWPTGWLRVRDEIRKIRRKRPYMTPAEFRALMKKKGIPGQAADDLASQLHHLGEILYFQEREQLASLVILNPEWVTELIALVMRSEKVREHGGMLRKADLDKLWRKAKLTPKIRRHLVNLMDWFDLTYATGDPKEIGIVVEALPYSTPAELKEISMPADRPHMEMIFRFPSLQRRLPPGIPTWGIARAHRFSTHTPWRDAACFVDKETNSYAQILASDATKQVRLRVVSDYPPFFFGRIEAILRDTFKRYPGAVPEWRIPCPCRPGCPHSYAYESVRKRWEDGKQSVTCEFGDDVSIQSLLTGFRKPESAAGVAAFQAEMRRQFTVLVSALRDKVEKTCPSVFTLAPSKSFKLLDTWMESVTQTEELELTLYCEHDSGWHATAHSLYRFRPDQEWFDEIKRRWSWFARVTKHVGPLAKTVGKAAQIPWAEVGGMGIEKLPEAPRSDTGKFAAVLGNNAEPWLIELETRHVLEQLIEHLDSKRAAVEAKNGGLHKFLMDDGRWLWLCPEHVRSYKTR